MKTLLITLIGVLWFALTQAQPTSKDTTSYYCNEEYIVTKVGDDYIVITPKHDQKTQAELSSLDFTDRDSVCWFWEVRGIAQPGDKLVISYILKNKFHK